MTFPFGFRIRFRAGGEISVFMMCTIGVKTRVAGEVEAAALARKLLETFLGHAPGRYENDRNGIRAGDWQAVAGAAHSLKPSAGHLGAGRLLEVCERMETTVENGDGTAVAAMAGEFDSVYAETIAATQAERPSWTPVKP